MALRFRNFVPYAIPGVLALLGCWWIYSWRKKYASYRDKQAIAIGREKKEEVSESGSAPKPEACVPRRRPHSAPEECPENRPPTPLLTPLLPAGPTTPSPLCQTHERPDLSQDLPDLSGTTVQPSTHEDDSEKLERIGSQEESGAPARAPLPRVPESAELSQAQGSSPSADRDQQPSAPLAQESLGAKVEISSAEQSDESAFKPPEEKQMPEIVQSDTGSVTAHCFGLEKETNAPQAFVSKEAEVVSSHEDSAVKMLPGSLEPACLKQSRDEEMPESIASVPVGREDTQPKGDELEREKIGGVSLDKEVEKIEQVAIQFISKVILAATEEVLSGSAGEASPRTCQATAGRAEAALGAGSGAALGAGSGAALGWGLAEGAAADRTPLPTPPEEQGQGATGSSCPAHGCAASPGQGDTGDCGVKSCEGRESQGVDRTRVENHRGPLKKSSLALEDSGYSTHTSEGGTSVEDLLQNTVLSVTSDQLSDSLSTSAAQDTSAEQSLVPRESPPALGLPGDSSVPYSNGILKEDGPDSSQECSSAAGMDGDHSEGSDANSVDFVDSGCAMRKTVARQNAKLEGGSSKPDFVIWEIEVPKELVGRLIGKQGRFMSYLRQMSGAKIYVSTLPYFRDSQVCHIEGTSHQVEKALSLIGKKFKELNVVPLSDEDHFSSEADAAVSEMTRGAVLVAQVTNYDSVTGLPLIQLWNLMGDEVVSINRTLVERGFARWLDY
ncbi:PREDICTED: A-kinase anchor protein 1, mitochondrial [Lepidothrix coronata]|uniref:A-kinase anchor protein 1, mitochondrial n=1 Tax=Lepidothrix coronata TaxID=321398 RepID=A0A6J0HR76_9PASS|nr:PREDICTED: A-kinase anchor protein 1, mitochondrial [Lepidothrix coronata]